MLQLIKEASGQNGVSARDDSPVTEVLNLVCPSTWRGACKTAVQLLFGQAGLVRPLPLIASISLFVQMKSIPTAEQMKINGFKCLFGSPLSHHCLFHNYKHVYSNHTSTFLHYIIHSSVQDGVHTLNIIYCLLNS